MSDRPSQDLPSDPSAGLPPALGQELRALYEAPGTIARGRDAAILAAARNSAPARNSGRWRIAAGLGIAAAFAIAATLYWLPGPPAPSPVIANQRTGDIRDAYAVARLLKKTAQDPIANAPAASPAPQPDWWDANRDGRIDQADVDTLAFAVVQLTPAGGVR